MSGASKASNALLAKCRARFGRALSAEELDSLLACRSIPELSSALRATGSYAPVLAAYDDASMRRRLLESLLDRALYDNLAGLCRYELSVGEWFKDYILLRGEIAQTTAFLRLLAAGNPQDFIFSLPEFMLKHSPVKLAELNGCRDYAQFLNVMRRSRFYKLLCVMAPPDGKAPDCAMIEQALYREFYRAIWALIEKHYSGNAQRELFELIGTRLDLINFCQLYRLKKYYSADPAQIRSMLIDRSYGLSRRLLDEMAEAKNADEALTLFVSKSSCGRRLDLELLSRHGVEAAADKLIYTRARRLMRSSVNPTTVLLSYITLAEAETQDIKTVIEGVFYAIPEEVIRNMIRIDDFAKGVN